MTGNNERKSNIYTSPLFSPYSSGERREVPNRHPFECGGGGGGGSMICFLISSSQVFNLSSVSNPSTMPCRSHQ